MGLVCFVFVTCGLLLKMESLALWANELKTSNMWVPTNRADIDSIKKYVHISG